MFADEDQVFEVVVNDEEQYSVWAADRALPQGWKPAGFQGVRSDCLAHIDKIWTDIRPLRTRQGRA
jgi:MbtH protein